MQILRRRRLLLALAVVLVAAAFAAAALASSGADRGSGASRRAGRGGAGLISAAAGYLGTSRAQLLADIRSGETLAAVARATGHSESGLVAALVAVRSRQLTSAEANLQQHVRKLVDGTHTRAALGLGSPRKVAAAYLGLTLAQLRAELRQGRTLASIADATPGHSEAGLIEALTDARRAQIAKALSSGLITQKQSERSLARLPQRMQALVSRPPGSGARRHTR